MQGITTANATTRSIMRATRALRRTLRPSMPTSAFSSALRCHTPMALSLGDRHAAPVAAFSTRSNGSPPSSAIPAIAGTRTVLLNHALPLSMPQPASSAACVHGPSSSSLHPCGELSAPLSLRYFDSAWEDLDGLEAAHRKPVILVMPSMSHSALVTRGERTRAQAASAVAGSKPAANDKGWWEDVVGRGSNFGIDLARFRVLSASPLGGPYGSSSPLVADPARLSMDGRAYRASFPLITPLDQARLYALMLDHLSLDKVHGIVGASMGGMAVVQFARHYPGRYERVAAICTTAQTSSSTQALRSVQRAAVRADPHFHGGNYPEGNGPHRGMAIARMFGTICYRSREEFDHRFDHRPRMTYAQHQPHNNNHKDKHAAASAASTMPSPSVVSDHLLEVESYLHHAASSFTGRYDANCYLTLSQCMDLMDIAQQVETPPAADATAAAAPASSPAVAPLSYEQACAQIPSSKQFLLLPIASDALIPPAELERLASVLGSQGKRVHVERIHSIFGHDAFLKDAQHTFNPRLAHFFDAQVEDGVQHVRQYVDSTLDLFHMYTPRAPSIVALLKALAGVAGVNGERAALLG